MWVVGKWEFRIQHDICNDHFKMLLMRESLNGIDYLSTEGLLHIPKEQKIDPDKVLWFEPDMLKAMINGLWNNGFRPDEVKMPRFENEEALLKNHLMDKKENELYLKAQNERMLSTLIGVINSQHA